MNKNENNAEEEWQDSYPDENAEGTESDEQPTGEEQDAEAQPENETEELRNKYLRLVAEFDNYRKRVARERVELIQTSEKDVVLSLLDVLDDADRATVEMGKTDDVNVVREGALLIFDKLRKALKARGLREMESLHNDFDAELQEAIAEIPAPSEDLKGKVLDDVQKGYYLNDKIIRHAKVVVGK